jgi:KDO2-lipid IV(A) lauroyltransferase
MFKALKYRILVAILKLFAHLPYKTLPYIGWLLGWTGFLFSKKNASRIRRHLHDSKVYASEDEYRKTLHANIQATGISPLESLHLWFKPYQKAVALVQECTGWEHVESSLKAGKGLIFLTPHLGCFEITSLYYGQHHPITVMFRQPRQPWLLPLITAGRQRGNVTLAPANSHGVKQVLQALKRGEAVGILPDQAPLEGEGEWAPFFGRPAYTMTLASKLAQKTGAQVLMAFGERLSGGRGYHIHIRPIATGGINTPTLLNAEIERTIQQCPAQYLWGYDRYKDRHQAPPSTMP